MAYKVRETSLKSDLGLCILPTVIYLFIRSATKPVSTLEIYTTPSGGVDLRKAGEQRLNPGVQSHQLLHLL